MAPSTKNRDRALDCLRMASCLLVLCRLQRGEPTGPGAVVWEALRRGTWSGVDLFFVLSGSLVGGLLSPTNRLRGSLDWRCLLVRRGCKNHPTFYVGSASFLVGSWVHDDLPPIRDILGEVYFSRNHLGGLRDHTGALAVPEHLSPHSGRETGRLAGPRLRTCPCLQAGAGDLPDTWTRLWIDSLASGVSMAQ